MAAKEELQQSLTKGTVERANQKAFLVSIDDLETKIEKAFQAEAVRKMTKKKKKTKEKGY